MADVGAAADAVAVSACCRSCLVIGLLIGATAFGTNVIRTVITLGGLHGG